MTELTLPTHRDDPETSHEAARSAFESADADRERVLKALRIFGPLTPYDVNDLYGWKYPRANRRMSDLERDGMVYATGTTGRTPSGGKSRVMAVSR